MVARDFLLEFFLFGAQFSELKGFRLLFRLREVIRIFLGFTGVGCAETQNSRCSTHSQF
jgi:hypothetical protein